MEHSYASVTSSIPRSNDDGHGVSVGYGTTAAFLIPRSLPVTRARRACATAGYCWAFISLLPRVVPFGGALLVIGSPIFGYGPYKQAIAVKGRISHPRQQRKESQKHGHKIKLFTVTACASHASPLPDSCICRLAISAP
ncbi:hypothetical protein M441DRAFT_417604 [Trichoderma asperellum CBS 433.97]|uniref:Uncharacterized protein n=1 Tax=Trichoderma asperellum (strain ATCC 204424 / CBS 433.97 / NBRC 101777) TaxID=1042311 RepID=A0A2T3Z8G8_TRIA4|nr:hypothetical protein M441DRAFT_417604 [Trichoderma asperellum CBS 433.97]PTB41098.1 hypothetical protein M441DRAFT_417604 [Trichoderma asperellum CBS 433.97]